MAQIRGQGPPSKGDCRRGQGECRDGQPDLLEVDRHARDQAAKSDRTWLSWHQSYLAEPKPVKEAIEAILRDMLVVEFVLPKVSGGAPVNRRGW